MFLINLQGTFAKCAHFKAFPLLYLNLKNESSFKPVKQDPVFDRKDPNLHVTCFMLGLEFKEKKRASLKGTFNGYL